MSNGEPKQEDQPTVNSQQAWNNFTNPPQQFSRFEEDLLVNEVLSREAFINKFFDPRRDYEKECGYPALETMTPDKYRDLYEIHVIAARVVELMSSECWQVQPTVFEDEDVNNITEFEEAWDGLGRSLRGESWHQDEEGGIIWEYLKRVDELSGIGRYGALLIGIDDSQELSEPAEFIQKRGNGRVTENAASRNLLFLRAFDESLCQILEVEPNQFSPRFGQPLRYRLTINDPRDAMVSAVSAPNSTVEVHWTRVQHVCDNPKSSEILGMPRMQQVLHRILDLTKLYGGSAEMYWRGAMPGWLLESHPQMGGNVKIRDLGALKDRMENLMNGLQRWGLALGVSAKSLAPQVVDPTPQIERQIEAICIKLGVPKRKFMGSERGELASSQDEKDWNDKIRYRNLSYTTPRLIVPFIDRLIQLGVLPVPKGYSVEWPDLSSTTDAERADIVFKRTQAMAGYVGGDVRYLISEKDFLTRELGYSEKEAEAIVETSRESVNDVEISPLADFAEQQAKQAAAVQKPISGKVGGDVKPKPKPEPVA